MSWTFAFLPTRLLREARFLELSPEDGGLLLRLYAACNRYGVGPANEFALRADTGLMLGACVRPALERLAASGLLTIYSARAAEWYRLDRYDEDAPADLRRKRGQSEHPLPDGSCGAARAPEDAPRPDADPEAPQGRRTADQRRHQGAPRAPNGGTAAPPGRPKGAERQTSGATRAPDAAPEAPPKKTERRQRQKEDSERASALSPADGRAREPAPAIAWPGPRAEACARLWLRRLDELAEAKGFAAESPQTEARLAQVAADVGETAFCIAVDLHLDAEPQWWGSPIPALRTRCKWAVERLEQDPSVGALRNVDRAVDARIGSGARAEARAQIAERTAQTEAARAAHAAVYSRARVAAGQEPVWHRMLVALRDRVSPFDFKQWITPLGLGASEESDLVVVVAPDESHAEWVRENHAVLLGAAFSEACNAPMRVEIVPPGQALGVAA